MSGSIREQIIDAIVDRMAIVREANGFATEIGAHVFRGAKRIGAESLDAVAVFARKDAAAHEYDVDHLTMPVDVQGVAAVADNGAETEQERAERVSQIIEKMLADIIEAMTGDRWTLTFTSGSREPVAGETVTGATSSATGFVESVTLTSGTWSGGDAAGTIKIRRKSGTFSAENLNIGAETNVASVSATVTREAALALVTASLADGIYYQGGGLDDYPDQADKTVGVAATFNITFPVVAGNPFAQP